MFKYGPLSQEEEKNFVFLDLIIHINNVNGALIVYTSRGARSVILTLTLPKKAPH